MQLVDLRARTKNALGSRACARFVVLSITHRLAAHFVGRVVDQVLVLVGYWLVLVAQVDGRRVASHLEWCGAPGSRAAGEVAKLVADMVGRDVLNVRSKAQL